MNIKIGARIRNLRILANITQEKLANHLGVSVQAVSRWESEICYPDLELIPAIAKYFGVTTDHILCIENETIQPIEKKFKEEWERAFNSGYTKIALDIINEALLTMPNNYEFMLMKAITLMCFYKHTCNITRVSDGDRLLRTIISLFDTISSECKNEDIRCRARVTKIALDEMLNNESLVIESADRLPKVKYTKNAVLSTYYRWDENKKSVFCRDYMLELLLEFIKASITLCKTNVISDNEKQQILEGAIQIIKITVDSENCIEFEAYLEEIYETLFTITEEDKYKNEIGKHIKMYNLIKDDTEYNSVFLKGVTFKKSFNLDFELK